MLPTISQIIFVAQFAAICRKLRKAKHRKLRYKKGFEKLLAESAIHVTKRYDNGELAIIYINSNTPFEILGHIYDQSPIGLKGLTYDRSP